MPAHHALGDRQQKAEGKQAINAKRVLRIMQVTGAAHWPPARTQPRQCRDRSALEYPLVLRSFRARLPQWRLLRALFAIDACDREVIAWSATTAGISGEMVRDLMIVGVERRFGTRKTAHVVEWLSDNGPAYIAKDTLDTVTALGLQLCFTPARSPESNGIAEAFVKPSDATMLDCRSWPDPATVIALLPAWFQDYNEVHPHSGLKFLSPREFLHLSA
jgi:putative transposase